MSYIGSSGLPRFTQFLLSHIVDTITYHKMNFVSRRSNVLSTKSIVSSSQPLASAVGNFILQSGGNAVDAAVGVAATLAVTEPASTGMGGDMFALFYDAKLRKVQGINASGRSGTNITFEQVKKLFPNEFRIPPHHGLAVTVPGVVAGWEDALNAWGTKTLQEVLSPAISLARNGFPVSQVSAYWWKRNGEEQLYSDSPFLPSPQQEGDIRKLPELACSLEIIAKSGKDGFYKGKIAKEICKAVKEHGGVLTESDLASHKSTFIDPVKCTYRSDYEVYECPPNGQGLGKPFILII